MTTVSIIGAGGKMGGRIVDNLVGSGHELRCVEPSEQGRAALAGKGLSTESLESAAAAAEVVILAVPDNRIGSVAAELVPQLRPGAIVIMLDAAAPFAGRLPERHDISYVACHPCHPPIFGDETDPDARKDYFGAVAAKQNVVIALIQGTEADYSIAEGIVSMMFAPVMTAFRVTLDDMVILEPVLAETTAATCITIIREALDEAISRGVPADAARAFLLGHINIELAVLFGEVGSPFSDGAIKAIEAAKVDIFQPDWKKVFEPENVRRSVESIVAE